MGGLPLSKGFKVSVPGKVILHGEHAVVYGMSAVAVSVNLRTQVNAETADSEVILKLMNFDGIEIRWTRQAFDKSMDVPYGTDSIPKPSPEMLHALHDAFQIDPGDNLYKSKITFVFLYSAIAKKNSKSPIAVKLTVSSDIPIGAGLGSSAAYSVAMAACILQSLGVIAESSGVPSENNLKLISDWAFQSEVILHGKPSGIDNSICTFGGALLFHKGQIKEINTKIPLYRILLVNTQQARDTRKLVEKVRDRYNLYQGPIESILEAIDEISDQCWHNLKNKRMSKAKQYAAAGDLIEMNHLLLNALGVGHPLLDRMVVKAAEHKLSAKLTGAGGGGCGFVLVDILEAADNLPQNQHLDTLKAELEGEGMLCYQVAMGCPGLLFSASEIGEIIAFLKK